MPRKCVFGHLCFVHLQIKFCSCASYVSACSRRLLSYRRMVWDLETHQLWPGFFICWYSGCDEKCNTKGVGTSLDLSSVFLATMNF
uniref:Secreted protein n=1 Tax=Pyxicephalus adspersus TaxID=30357 RepID=A0AAV3ANS8_PYXAD|nr:TPA: hypothetical protein GDO54_010016 [Pyxicephalus adspersus]